MSSDVPIHPDVLVSDAVSKWLNETQALHAQVQAAMEQIRLQPGLGPEAERLIKQLLVVLRQRQAQAPTPDMVRTWVRVISHN
jgi:hypothetical protein